MTDDLVDYRLVRPDGTELWRLTQRKAEPISAPGHPDFADRPECWPTAPWRLEGKDRAGGGWVLYAEASREPALPWRIRIRRFVQSIPDIVDRVLRVRRGERRAHAYVPKKGIVCGWCGSNRGLFGPLPRWFTCAKCDRAAPVKDLDLMPGMSS